MLFLKLLKLLYDRFFLKQNHFYFIFFEHPASLAKTSVEQSIASAITFGKDSGVKSIKANLYRYKILTNLFVHLKKNFIFYI